MALLSCTFLLSKNTATRVSFLKFPPPDNDQCNVANDHGITGNKGAEGSVDWESSKKTKKKNYNNNNGSVVVFFLCSMKILFLFLFLLLLLLLFPYYVTRKRTKKRLLGGSRGSFP